MHVAHFTQKAGEHHVLVCIVTFIPDVQKGLGKFTCVVFVILHPPLRNTWGTLKTIETGCPPTPIPDECVKYFLCSLLGSQTPTPPLSLRNAS